MDSAVPPENPGPPSPEDEPLGAGIDFTDPNSPLAPYYLRASPPVAVLLVGLLLFLYNGMPLKHTDVWGHLKFGEHLVRNRELPDREPFSPHADHSQPYVHFQWLTQSLFHLVFRGGEGLAGGDELRRLEGGVDALRCLHLLLTLVFLVAVLVAYRRAANSLPLACAGLVLLVLLSPALLGVFRPQVVGVACFAVLLAVLSRKPGPSRASLFTVPLLLVFWANSHGSFTVGLFLIGVFLAGRGIEVCYEAGTWNLFRGLRDSAVRALLLMLLASTAAVALLNPHGPMLLVHVFKLAGHPNIATLREWQPLELFGPEWEGWAYPAGVVLLALTQAVSPRWYSPTQWLVMLGFGVWPLFQLRMMTWWVVLVPWLLLPHWKAVGEKLAWKWLHFESVLSFRKTLVAVMLGIVTFLWLSPAQWLFNGRPRPIGQSVTRETPWRIASQLLADPEAKPVPVPELANELRKHYGGRFHGTILASETVGDYLLWKLPPDMPVLVYTHLHLFSRQHWDDVRKVLNGRPGFAAVLTHYRVNLIVAEVTRHGALYERLRQEGEWIVVDPGRPSPLFVAVRRVPL